MKTLEKLQVWFWSKSHICWGFKRKRKKRNS